MSEADKAKLRAWLFQLLADLETHSDVLAEKEESGNKVTITILWKT